MTFLELFTEEQTPCEKAKDAIDAAKEAIKAAKETKKKKCSLKSKLKYKVATWAKDAME